MSQGADRSPDHEQATEGGAWIRAVHRGHAPNCSATGSIVGDLLLSAAATAALINVAAVWLAARARGERASPPPRLRRDRQGGVLLVPPSAPLGPARLELTPAGVSVALKGGATLVGQDQIPAPDEVHLSVTDRCPVGCAHCYIGATPAGEDTDLERALRDLDDLKALGVHEIALGGGEVALSPHTLTLVRAAHDRGMTPSLTTSGAGLSPSLAASLAPFVGQVNVSLDGALRSPGAAAVGWRALQILLDQGIRVGVNTVLTQRTWPDLEAMAAALALHPIAEWQWLRLKPSGRGVSLYRNQRLSRDQALAIWPSLLHIERVYGLTIRIDCAMVPYLAAHDLPVGNLRAHGVYGCPGGERLLTRTAAGRWLPCSFAAELGEPPSERLSEALQSDPLITSWRERAAAPPEPCASCPYREVCRGGCRIVAAHLTGDPLAPDPECPRVSP